MANTEGGTLYLGVEDDGMVTGVCDRHRNVNGLAAFIFNKTVPQLSVRVTLLSESGKRSSALRLTAVSRSCPPVRGRRCSAG